MNLLNIPKDYIPTSEEMILLRNLICAEATFEVYSEGVTLRHGKLRALQRKLNLLDSIFRASEQPSCGEHLAGTLPNEVTNTEVGLPPYPTDESGSFKI